MGSSDLDDWFREAKESITGFWKSHVEQPVCSSHIFIFNFKTIAFFMKYDKINYKFLVSNLMSLF